MPKNKQQEAQEKRLQKNIRQAKKTGADAKQGKTKSARSKPSKKGGFFAGLKADAPQTVQQSIPYREMYRDGICRLTDTLYTKTVQFFDINYQLAQAEAQELNARNNLSYTEVKSPSDGVVGMLPYRAGALVSASIPQPLTTVSDNSNMYVYFSMTENQLLAMSRQYKSMDEALENMPEVSLKLNDQSIYEQKGKIESISGVIDRKTGTVGVRAVFPNESRLLHSGASGNVLIPQAYKDCIVIPQGATVRLQDKTLVYKVVDGKAVSTLITVAEINDGREYIVLDGLKVGEEIVSEGAGLVREGTQVK